jgi:hypothetical protein
MLAPMSDIDVVWERIRTHAGDEFLTVTGKTFTYVTPGNFLRITRDGREINRSLSRTNFEHALILMPAAGPGELKDRQGPSYTRAILMDPRIRQRDW